MHRRAALSVPRQNGKSWLVIAFCVYAAVVLGARVAYTAHLYSTVGEIWERFKDIFGSKARDPHAKNPDLNRLVAKVRGTTSQEAVVLKNGGEIHCFTRTDSSGRGQSYDFLIVDEAQEFTASQQKAILALNNAGALGNPITVYLGTPPGPECKGTVFRDVREDALESARCDGPGDICWIEWGATEVGDITDPARWRATNPSIGALSDERSFRAAARSMRSDPLGFAVEYLGYWPPRASLKAVISRERWDACATLEAPEPQKLCAGVKFDPSGETVALAIAAREARGTPHVELIELARVDAGLTWLADWLCARTGRMAAVAIDGKSGSGALCDLLKERRAPRGFVLPMAPGDAISAAAGFSDAVAEARVTHWSDECQGALDSSALTSHRRRIGSAGGWGFGGDESAPVEACAAALWCLSKTKRNPNRKRRVS